MSLRIVVVCPHAASNRLDHLTRLFHESRAPSLVSCPHRGLPQSVVWPATPLLRKISCANNILRDHRANSRNMRAKSDRLLVRRSAGLLDDPQRRSIVEAGGERRASQAPVFADPAAGNGEGEFEDILGKVDGDCGGRGRCRTACRFGGSIQGGLLPWPRVLKVRACSVAHRSRVAMRGESIRCVPAVP